MAMVIVNGIEVHHEVDGPSDSDVAGTSFGEMVALNLVLRRPDLIDRLVLLVTSPGGTDASYPFSDLDAIEHPTFIACGPYDDVAPVANSQLLADRMPNAQVQVFDGGHVLGFQDPSMWPTVIEFLS